MATSSRIHNLLDEIITLPSQPTTLARITELMDDPNVSTAEVARVVSADPAIAIKALRLVNSAHYGIRNQVVSVEHAVMLLGLKVIRNLVLTAIVFETFKKGAVQLLRHSVACGLALRAIAASDNRSEEQVEDVFVYGLLHDIGKIIFQEFLAAETQRVVALCDERDVPWFEAERLVLGCDHAELGAELARKWNLAPHLVSTTAGHHDLSRCETAADRFWAGRLAIADYICWCSGLVSVAHGSAHVAQDAWEAAELRSRDLTGILESFFSSLPELDELVELAR